MIITIIITIFLFFVNAILFIFPNGGVFPTGFTQGMSQVWFTIRSWDFLLPVDAIIQCLAIAFIWWTFLFIWGAIHWILRKFPFLNIG